MATLPSVIAFNAERCTLTFRRQPGLLTLQSNEVYATQVKDLDEGLGLLSALVESINAVWEHREELTAVKKSSRMPGPLDIWALLPETNCKDCGEPTCMAFAVGLLQSRRLLLECEVLKSDVNFTERRTTLEAMLRHL
jgi:ArsR family metal-binding transcriptional regulator